MTILTTSQISQLLITANGHPLGVLIHLAVATGLREMELLGLKWTDLDWIKQTLKVERQLDRPSGDGDQCSAPKTRAGRRTIYLDAKTEGFRYRRVLDEEKKDQAQWIKTSLGLIILSEPR
jgi:integrase